MANTISILSYTNTFGDWFVNTNALAKENNEFGSNNYIKPTGTLYLNDPGLGLQVANNAIIAGQLQVQGIGSSAYVQNNLRVDTQVYFTNTTLGLTNSGQAIIGKDLLVLGSGTGLRVANNTLIGGTLTANGITQLNNDLNVSGNTSISNTVYVRSNTYFANSIVVSKDVWTKNLSTSDVVTVGSDLNVINNTYTNALQANASVNTASLTVTGPGFFNTIQSNTRINTSTLTVTGNSYTNISIANSSVNTPLVNTDVVNTALVQTNTLNVIGTQYVNTINANTLITVPTITIPNNGFIDAGSSGARISANQMSVGTAGLSVQGNFTINGATIYNAPVFTLSAGTPNPALVYNPGIAVYRSTANAIIRWNETNKYWDTLDVLNGNYYRILTDEHFSSSTTSSSSTNVATSLAVSSANTQLKAYTDGFISYATGVDATQNTRLSTVEANTVYLFGALNQTNTNIVSANTQLKAYTAGAITSANTQLKAYTDGAISSSVSSANTQLKSYTDGAISSANTQLKAYTDGAIVSANGNIQSQFGTVYTFATNAYARANTSANSFVGTSGTALPNLGSVTFNSTNGITVVGSTNTLTVNTPQDLRATAGPSFSSITSTVATGTSPLTVSSTTQVNNLNAQYLGGNASSFYTSASNLSTGTLPNARLSSIPNSALASSTISGVALGGTLNTLTFGTHLTGSSYNGSGAVTLATNATNLNTGSTLVARDASGNFNAGTITATFSGNLTGSVTGNCSGTAGSVAWGNVSSKPFSYSGQSGQPSWLWGTNDGVTYNVWNPSNFNVNYATTSGTAGNITNFTVNQNVGNTNDVQFRSLGVSGGTLRSRDDGEILATGQITAYYSDERLKTKLGNIENALDKVSSLNGFYYEANETAQKLGYISKREVGVSAQEVQSILPEVVVPAPIDQKYLTIHYERLVPLLIEAIKELKWEIEVLKNK